MDEWNKILSGDLKDKIKNGFKIIGPNLVDYNISTWYAASEEEAVRLATHFSERTCCRYEIIMFEFVGVVRPKLPVEYVKADFEFPNSDQEVKVSDTTTSE